MTNIPETELSLPTHRHVAHHHVNKAITHQKVEHFHSNKTHLSQVVGTTHNKNKIFIWISLSLIFIALILTTVFAFMPLSPNIWYGPDTSLLEVNTTYTAWVISGFFMAIRKFETADDMGRYPIGGEFSFLSPVGIIIILLAVTSIILVIVYTCKTTNIENDKRQIILLWSSVGVIFAIIILIISFSMSDQIRNISNKINEIVGA